MPVIRQHRIYRQDLRANPSVLYLFGDNEKRVGFGGQAAEMRDEPNAVGVCTKASPGGYGEFWSDANFESNAAIIEADLATAFDQVKAGAIVVIPLDGLGTGLARLKEKAPKTFEYLSECLEQLEKI